MPDLLPENWTGLLGISEATFNNWRKNYGGLGVSEPRRLKQLEVENRRLKQIVADLSLDKPPEPGLAYSNSCAGATPKGTSFVRTRGRVLDEGGMRKAAGAAF